MIPDQLEQQIYQCLDGKMSDAEKQALFLELKNNPEAMKLYCLSASLDANLNRIAHGQLSLNTASENFADLASKSQKRKSFKIAVLAAAAVVVIGLITMQLFMVKEQPPTITFATSPGTQFELSHSITKDAPKGMTLEKGSRLQLSQGTVELTFASGVRSIIMAPADITLHKDDTLFMNRGTAWFQVPQQATGFTVKTKDLDIIDLGTEFGVLAKPNAHDEVHVFKGKVQVIAKRLRKESTTLTTGEARRIDPIGRLSTIPPRSSAFLTYLPKSLPYFHWSFDNLEDKHLIVRGSHPQVNEIKTDLIQADKNKPFGNIPGKFGNALSFPDAQSHIKTNWSGIGGDTPRTVSYWIKLEPRKDYIHQVVGWGGFMGKDDWASTSQFYSFVETGGRDKTIIGVSMGAHWILGSTPVADEKWHHVAYTYTGHSKPNGEPEMYLYIDGKLEKTSSLSAPKVPVNKQGDIDVNTDTTGGTAPLIIFGDSWGADWNNRGQDITPLIDELFIFEAALSNQQIRNLYHHNDYKGTSP